MIDEEIDILGLNETNIDQREGVFRMRRMKGYNIFASNRDKKKNKGSGVALIINNNKWYRKMGPWKSNTLMT